MIYDPRRRAVELCQRIIESVSAEELEEYAKVSDTETPEETLLRTAKEVSNELYYVRRDAPLSGSVGVMQRLIAAVAEVDRSK
jgi:hypothetical protein